MKVSEVQTALNIITPMIKQPRIKSDDYLQALYDVQKQLLNQPWE